ncbi:MAG TPA: flagellar protein FlgN [Clostridiaceae bacterium]|nr:flagellar protein FlgN [Clostridiaceae bacterium]
MNNYIEELIGLLESKQKLLQTILSLTQEQARAIDEENVEELEKMVEEKQVHIDRINIIDKEFNFIYAEFKEKFGSLDINNAKDLEVREVKRLKDEVAKTMELIKSIFAIEESNNDKAGKLLQKISDSLKSISQTKKVTNAYDQKAYQVQPHYIDKKK